MRDVVSLTDRAARLSARVGRRRRSVRLQLTLVYSGLFLVLGIGLLALTYVLAATRFPVGGRDARAATVPGGPVGTGGSAIAGGGGPGQLPAGAAAAHAQALRELGAALHSLLMMSGVALAAMTLISIMAGWLVAGRVLRPLRTVTTAARRISASNLHERLALTGPADELKELGDTFDGLLGRLEGAFDAQRQFVANASHELRTPLARQRALIEVALDDRQRTAGSLERACERVLASNGHQERLIDALLALAHSQRGLDRRGPIDLAAVVGDVLRARQPDAQSRGLRVSATLAAAPALGDGRLAERLAVNLVSNAIGHNVPGGWIEIVTGVQDGCATLSVANAGSVIPPDEVDRLFEPFRRLSADRTGSHDGPGLGLSIVRAIVSAHEAKLSASALPGGGLEIGVRFPRIPAGLSASIPSAIPHAVPH
jgi:signal transduction histidine kinase